MIGSVSIVCVVMSLPGAAAFARPIRGITMGNAFDARIKPMADPNEAPSPAVLREMADKANAACVGHPHAKIPWPHRLLHDLESALRACATALEAKDREIARLDPMRSLKCPHGWLSWECSECIRARGKEPKP